MFSMDFRYLDSEPFQKAHPGPTAPLAPPPKLAQPGWIATPYLCDFFHHCSPPVYPDAIPHVFLFRPVDRQGRGFTKKSLLFVLRQLSALIQWYNG
jgi:hypothetical protein